MRRLVVASAYAGRAVLPDTTANPRPEIPRSLVRIKVNLYRHTNGAGLAVHSGFVLVTSEGSLVVDPAMTCTAGWLRDKIRKRFDVPVRYETLDRIALQDVDVIDVGHYTPAAKTDEAALRTYLVDIHQQVLDLVRDAASWDQLYRKVTFSDELKGWTAFDTIQALNVLGMTAGSRLIA